MGYVWTEWELPRPHHLACQQLRFLRLVCLVWAIGRQHQSLTMPPIQMCQTKQTEL